MAEETKEAKALSAAVEVVKVTLTLATGTLIFSANLLKEDVTINGTAKCLLVAAWCLLGVSILAGAMAYMRVPVMLAEDNPDIHDKWFAPPGKIHHIAFLVGVAVLGIGMILILSYK